MTNEKQIPQKVEWEREWETDNMVYIDIPYCPTCGNEVVQEEHHCKCGQALDWGDVE